MVARLWSCRVPGHAIGLINPAQAQRCPMESASPHAESKTYSAGQTRSARSTAGWSTVTMLCSQEIETLVYALSFQHATRGGGLSMQQLVPRSTYPRFESISARVS